jgi:hypothetical protein
LREKRQSAPCAKSDKARLARKATKRALREKRQSAPCAKSDKARLARKATKRALREKRQSAPRENDTVRLRPKESYSAALAKLLTPRFSLENNLTARLARPIS